MRLLSSLDCSPRPYAFSRQPSLPLNLVIAFDRLTLRQSLYLLVSRISLDHLEQLCAALACGAFRDAQFALTNKCAKAKQKKKPRARTLEGEVR